MTSSSPWLSTRLGEIVAIKHGWPFQSDLFSQELTGRPIIVSIGNFEYTGGFRFESTRTKEYRGEYPLEYELSPGDILLVMTCQTAGGEILGIPGRIPDDGRTYLHNQRMGKVDLLRPDLVDLDYLYWLFLWKPFNQSLFNSASGTKILHTSPGRIEAFRFNLPPLPEQRAIARILGALDDKIELNRRQNATLEELARAIFKSWFVNFDPVRAKAEGRAPAAMDAATAALFPDGFEERDGREVPRGWRMSTIGEATRVVGGSTPSSSEPAFWEGGTHYWATPKDLSSVSTVPLLETERRITDAGLNQISSGLLPKGTVLLSSRAPIGYTVIVEVPVAINQGFIAMVCERELPHHYVLWWTRENMETIKGRANGTTFLEVSKANFRPLNVLVPSSPILRAFVTVVEPLYQKVRANLQQSRTLAALRDALLPRLLSGELRVREAERLVEEKV